MEYFFIAATPQFLIVCFDCSQPVLLGSVYNKRLLNGEM